MPIPTLKKESIDCRHLVASPGWDIYVDRRVPWLPRPHTFQLIYPPRSLSGSTKVADLMASGACNEALINEEFGEADASCSLSIPLPEQPGRDEMIWHYERTGRFFQ
ncbi:UNVERIFIED_CONTAM: hypothetical protein Slati_2985600 [Sesamum latifolium]|uniref:LysR family transcriptional regulator n=1 Tax=Sesamum latifolium TaxID=2727402 RepID=A0AAW2VFU4_9LAMI